MTLADVRLPNRTKVEAMVEVQQRKCVHDEHVKMTFPIASRC